jgi:hypothetical protein
MTTESASPHVARASDNYNMTSQKPSQCSMRVSAVAAFHNLQSKTVN